jgi:SAM-dependent methyltransferase
MNRPEWAPESVDLSKPSIARAYDYWLGGAHNFAVDREFSRKLFEAVPDTRLMARANRAFLHRAVRFLVGAGIRQFLDIGSGIPTVGNVHEIAQQAAPEARVVYVDIDPVAVAHSELILAGNERAAAVREDVRDPEKVLAHPRARELLDFGQPVGLLLVAVLHYVPDQDDPYAVVARLRRALCPGSYVVIAHPTADSRPGDARRAVRMTEQTATTARPRPRAEVERLFAGLELVEPGLVWAPLWRPDRPGDDVEEPERSVNYVGVGRVG